MSSSMISSGIGSSSASALGSNLGPFTAENRRTKYKTTQYQPKRDNKLTNQFLVRDQGVGGSNPLSPTNLFCNLRRGHLPLNSVLCRSLCRNWLFCLSNRPGGSQSRPMPSA